MKVFHATQVGSTCVNFYGAFALVWEGKGNRERACGNSGQVCAFNGEVGACSLLLSLLHPKDVLNHTDSFVPARWNGAGCLHKALLPPHRRPLCPPGPTIRILTIQYGRGCGLAHAIRAVAHRGLDL